MTPQSSFAVIAPIEAGQESDLRALLASMNHRPGVVDPENKVVPFGRFERLHFARFVVLDDPTVGDIAVHGVTPPRYPALLAFVGDCDGPAPDFLRELARDAGPGLERIFAHCRGFPAGGDLFAWMTAHDHPAATHYVNWVGRTVRQVRDEHALRQARRLAKNLTGPPRPYGYRMLGQVATLGRFRGIAEIPGLRLRGFPGWFVARTYHLYQLPLLSRKLRVVLDWTVALFFRRDVVELSMLGHPPRLGE